MRCKDNAGFTLIEISIVLVIIGLIVGGVLLGRDLIEAAKTRKDFTTIQKTDTAINTFRLKYGALPGDIAYGDRYGWNAGANGDADGTINGTNPGFSRFVTAAWGGYIPEWYFVTYHLGKAQLIDLGIDYTAVAPPRLAGYVLPAMESTPGQGTNGGQGQPAIMLFFEKSNTIARGHYHRMGTSEEGLPYVRFYGGFTPLRAYEIDKKFDDGTAVTGRIMPGPLYIQGAGDIYDTTDQDYERGGINNNAWHCGIPATNTYDTAYQFRSCALRVKASF